MSKVHFLCLAFLPSLVFGQALSAEYSCSIKYGTTGISLDYTGKYFFYQNKSLSYLIPEYLEQYPNGRIQTKSSIIILPADTIQSISYINLNSENVEFINGKHQEEYSLTKNHFFWKVMDDTATISGLFCQKASWSNTNNGEPVGTVWFCANIPAPTTFNNIFGTPGLVVSIEQPYFSAALRWVNISKSIPEDIMYPKILQEYFRGK